MTRIITHPSPHCHPRPASPQGCIFCIIDLICTTDSVLSSLSWKYIVCRVWYNTYAEPADHEFMKLSLSFNFSLTFSIIVPIPTSYIFNHRHWTHTVTWDPPLPPDQWPVTMHTETEVWCLNPLHWELGVMWWDWACHLSSELGLSVLIMINIKLRNSPLASFITPLLTGACNLLKSDHGEMLTS